LQGSALTIATISGIDIINSQVNDTLKIRDKRLFWQNRGLRSEKEKYSLFNSHEKLPVYLI
jgi:hypothetical protein